MTLYGAAKAPAIGLAADGTTVAALTDSSTGTASETLAAATNIDLLVDNSTGSVSDTLAAATNIATLADNTSGVAGSDLKEVVPGGAGATAGAFNDAAARDAAIVIINDNFKDLVVAAIAQKAWNTAVVDGLASTAAEVITQRAWNIAVLNSVASLAAKISSLIDHANDGR